MPYSVTKPVKKIVLPLVRRMDKDLLLLKFSGEIDGLSSSYCSLNMFRFSYFEEIHDNYMAAN